MSKPTGNVIYEVDLWIDTVIADDYRSWLAIHVGEMLALPGFVEARIFDVLEPAPPPGEIALCVHYTLHDHAALDEYLRLHARRLREEGVARFGSRFRAQRRVLADVAVHHRD
ncbi:MAG: DUF4286 family protein [Luteimonas sp.]